MAAVPASMTKRHPNNPAGVRAMLGECFSCTLKIKTYESDPQAAGVWRVTAHNGSQAIVYLAGYEDSWGQVREYNDAEFEDGYPA